MFFFLRSPITVGMCKVFVLPTTSDDSTIDIILFKPAITKENVAPMNRPATGPLLSSSFRQLFIRFGCASSKVCVDQESGNWYAGQDRHGGKLIVISLIWW
jgi:hypothetical protein